MQRRRVVLEHTLERRTAFDVSVVVRIQPNKEELRIVRARSLVGLGAKNLGKLLAGMGLARRLGQIAAGRQCATGPSPSAEFSASSTVSGRLGHHKVWKNVCCGSKAAVKHGEFLF